MQVTYNGFTGELVKLEKKATVYFTGVKLEDVKFSCGEVMFGG